MSERKRQRSRSRDRAKQTTKDRQSKHHDQQQDARKPRQDKHHRNGSVANNQKQQKNEKQETHKQPVKDEKAIKQVTLDPEQEVTDDLLQSIMGFSVFASSKGQNHSQSTVEFAQKASAVKRKYRQYMNRRGGFNRKLDTMN